ncbi:MAG: sulfatase [Planctomycetota bacterium]|nr:sulfatase [Planctomycetaceae bacterium]MDQ3331376.1 sulfatase [Planctomycetota bacterium]
MRSIVTVLLLLVSVASHAADKPNVLFIAVDDMRPDLGCYGAGFVTSPNLDRLAASGVTFTRAYCQQAVCSPSRTSLLTGKRPDTTQVHDLVTHFRDTIPDTVTLPQIFKRNGYQAVGMGKIYHGGYDDEASWSEPHRSPKGTKGYAIPENQKIVEASRAKGKARGLEGKALQRAGRGPATESADVPDDAYHDGAVAEMAIESLETFAHGDEPFFLAVGFVKPHLPFVSPKKYWDLYDRQSFALPGNYDVPTKDAPPFAGTNWGELRNYSDIPENGALDADKALELIHGYYAALSYTDAQIGKLLDALDEQNLAENTIVVVWGDHGWKLGDHGMWCKHTNYELDAHVPLIMRAPGKQAGIQSERLVEFVDIYPTLAELAGLDAPSDLEGTSFAPLLDDPNRPWKAAAFSQYPRAHERQQLMGYSMATDRHRLTRWADRENPSKLVATELYDHETDPAENVNVAEHPEYAKTLAELSALAEKGWRGVRDELKK